jgi:hypothetical protein
MPWRAASLRGHVFTDGLAQRSSGGLLLSLPAQESAFFWFERSRILSIDFTGGHIGLRVFQKVLFGGETKMPDY